MGDHEAPRLIMNFSIIIATFDRPDALDRLLRGIANHFVKSPFSFEVVIANNARDDAIAVHGFGQIRGSNIDVAALLAGRIRVFGHHESKTRGIRLQPANHQIHLLGNTKTIAANLQERSIADERSKLALEMCALVTWHP